MTTWDSFVGVMTMFAAPLLALFQLIIDILASFSSGA